MTTTKDNFLLARVRGHVTAHWVRPGFHAYPAFDVHNTLSYTAADVLAAAYGGDTTRIPKYVGFIYSDNQDAVLQPITRNMTLASIRAEVEDIAGNMLVVRFSRRPSIAVNVAPEPEDSCDNMISEGSPETDVYQGNIVEFHAVTRSDKDGIYESSTSADSVFAGPLTSGKAIHRAVLLGDGRNPCEESDRYTVLAMVDLKKHKTYRLKPENYELALDWRVTFE